MTNQSFLRRWFAFALVLVLGCVGCASAPSGKAEVSAKMVGVERSNHAYGSETEQFGTLHRRPGRGTYRVVVLIHGGFWKQGYGLDLMTPLGDDLANRGFAVWNIEYRRVGQPGGGWRGTLDDVAAAVEYVPSLARAAGFEVTDVSVVGHSAGGHLALWLGGLRDFAVPIKIAVGQGPVADLEASARADLGGGAVQSLLGGTPAQVPERYRFAQPERSTGTTRQVAVVGRNDDIVPPEFSRGFETIEVPDTDHFDLIDPTSTAWATVINLLGPT
jgi:acetyl esterase/lipase